MKYLLEEYDQQMNEEYGGYYVVDRTGAIYSGPHVDHLQAEKSLAGAPGGGIEYTIEFLGGDSTNEMLVESDAYDDVVFELADAMDISTGESEKFIDDLSYVLAYTLKTSKANMIGAIVKSFASNPKIVDAMAVAGGEKEAIKKLRSNISDERSWGQLMGFFKKTNLFPPEIMVALDQMRKAVY